MQRPGMASEPVNSLIHVRITQSAETSASSESSAVRAASAFPPAWGGHGPRTREPRTSADAVSRGRISRGRISSERATRTRQPRTRQPRTREPRTRKPRSGVGIRGIRGMGCIRGMGGMGKRPRAPRFPRAQTAARGRLPVPARSRSTPGSNTRGRRPNAVRNTARPYNGVRLSQADNSD